MPTPLPPMVHGPITPLSPAVRVTGILASAQVRVLMDGRGRSRVRGDHQGETHHRNDESGVAIGGQLLDLSREPATKIVSIGH